MKRIFVTLTCATVLIFGGLIYQYSVQKKEAIELQTYHQVLNEKVELLATEAQDWSKPIELDIHDTRLEGDYKVMQEFIVSKLMQKAERRNQYLRDLKAVNWHRFLSIQRFDADKKNNYIETQSMLSDVKKIVAQYELDTQQFDEQLLKDAHDLKIKSRFKRELTESLQNNQDMSADGNIFEVEKLSLEKAEAIFALLKNNKWEKRQQLYMFYEDKPLKQFNQLYKELVQLNKQMEQVKQDSLEEVEANLSEPLPSASETVVN